MSYQLNKSHLLICILAALVITAGFIIHYLVGSPFPLFNMALWVSLVIVIFYFVGHIARAILIHNVFAPAEIEELIDEELELEVGEEVPDVVMEYTPVEPPVTEQDLVAFESDEIYHEPTAEELMDRIALGDVS
ncbi:MAG: hypothetical protein FWB91_03430 [Defluviitaleaceae bacterium]|nr:hypothetical protein [Defluviitaleaceae bacterium]